MKRTKTNDQLLRAFLKDLTPMQLVILRERIVTISELTRKDIEGENRKQYNSPFYTATDFLILCDKIDQHLDFKDF